MLSLTRIKLLSFAAAGGLVALTAASPRVRQEWHPPRSTASFSFSVTSVIAKLGEAVPKLPRQRHAVQCRERLERRRSKRLDGVGPSGC
jgi:hypothetical protein